MAWVKRLMGKTIAIDTAPLIYLVEENPYFLEQVEPFFSALGRGEFIALTSVLTITETLVVPLRLGLAERMQRFKKLLAEYMLTIPVSSEIAETAAQLRADYALRTPDAVQIATAIVHKADFFLTNDARLGRIRQVEVLLLSALV